MIEPTTPTPTPVATEDARSGAAPWGWPETAILALAAALRLVGLGRFSLWLDEILQVSRARLPMAEAASAMRGNVDHPPLDNWISWLVAHAGGGETSQRLVHVGWGVLGVAVLMAWSRRRVSRRLSWIVGALVAVAPFHVRYSQEIRPYALAMTLALVVLALVDRGLDEPQGRGSWIVLALAAAALVQTHHLAAAVTGTTAALWAAPRLLRPIEPAARRRAVRAIGVLVVAMAVSALPLVATYGDLAERTPQAGAADWDAAAVGRRIEALTVGYREGLPLGAGGVAWLALLVAGAAFAGRTAVGRRWLMAATLGLGGVELLLCAVDHWSNARYDAVAWPFLVLLVALGVDGLAATVGRRGGSRAEASTLAVLLAALLLPALRGLHAYAERGRPHWDEVARRVSELAVERRILVSNEWTRVSLGYYLAERGDDPSRLEVVDDPRSAKQAAARRRGCTLVVVAGYPRHRELIRVLRRTALKIEFPETDAVVHGLDGAEERCPRAEPLGSEAVDEGS